MEAGNRGLCWIVTCNCVIMIEIQTIAGSWIRCLLTRGDLILVLFNRLIWLFFNFLVILYFVRCDTCKFHLCCQFCSPRLVETFTIHFHLFTLVKRVVSTVMSGPLFARFRMVDYVLSLYDCSLAPLTVSIQLLFV